jgi:hypothetical protein
VIIAILFSATFLLLYWSPKTLLVFMVTIAAGIAVNEASSI